MALRKGKWWNNRKTQIEKKKKMNTERERVCVCEREKEREREEHDVQKGTTGDDCERKRENVKHGMDDSQNFYKLGFMTPHSCGSPCC